MNAITAVTDYLRSSKAELQKVSWPSRKDTIRYSSLVLGISLVVAIFFAGLDYGLNALTTQLLTLRVNAGTQAPASTTDQPVTTPVVPGLDITNDSGTFIPTDVKTEPTTGNTNSAQ
ncbi:MAG: preprotein translocase subunit SecE [Patescibacteria group bacterium]